MDNKRKIEILKADLNTLKNMQLLLQNVESEAFAGAVYSDIQNSITDAKQHLLQCIKNLR